MSTTSEMVRAYLSEPAVADPPRRVWRDWALVAITSTTAILEATLRTDADWAPLPLGWQIASVVVFFATVPTSLLIRRTRPLASTALAFGGTVTFGILVAIFQGPFGGLMTTAVVLVVAYTLYRWGSGRDGAIGAVILLAALVLGSVADPGNIGDVIGGAIVLALPVAIGLMVRYRSTARERAVAEAKSREREEIARELHDTVAHHVSAIAVQAQAGRAVAEIRPEQAVEVLAVIEEAASRTLEEMRTMVGTLRNGADAELAPQQGLADVPRLARDLPGDLVAEVEIDGSMAAVGPAVDAALFRIAQESLTNAVRHARGARHVRVCVAADGDDVRLTVTDDGTAPAAAHAAAGYGLTGMAERAHLLGGRFEAGPDPAGGWRVVAVLPRVEGSVS